MKRIKILLFISTLLGLLISSCNEEQDMKMSNTSNKVYINIVSQLPTTKSLRLVDSNNDGNVKIDWKVGETITASALLINQKNISESFHTTLIGRIDSNGGQYTVNFSLKNPLEINREDLYSGKWYINILFYLQDTNVLPSDSRVNIAYTDPGKINNPISSGWVNLLVKDDGGNSSLKSPTPVVFNPMGSIISFVFKSSDNYVACDSIVFDTDLFNVSSSISLPEKLSKFDINNLPPLVSGSNTETQVLKLSALDNTSSSDNVRYYFWCMPNPQGGTHLQARLFRKGSDTPTYTTNKIDKHLLLTSGKSYKIALQLTPEAKLIPITLHTNFGIDERKTIYVQEGKPVPVSVLNDYINQFRLPGATFRGWNGEPLESYDLTEPKYKTDGNTNGTISLNGERHLFAIWKIDQDVYVPSDFRNEDVFAKGVTAPKPSDWSKMYSGGRTVFWTKGCGWYHTYQFGDLMCWAATTSNILLWWMDQNKENIEKYNSILGEPFYEHYNDNHPNSSYKVKAIDMTYINAKACGVYNGIFKTFFENQDGHAVNAFSWFMSALGKGGGVVTGLKPEYNNNSGGFFKDIFNDKYSVPMKRTTTIRKRSFNIFISQALHKGYALSIETKSHAWNLWGAHFDADGYVDVLYTTDSKIDDSTEGLGDIHIVYEETNPITHELHPKLVMSGGLAGIYSISCYSLGEDEWNSYFTSKSK